MYRKRPPDWNFWKQKTYVQLWEAAFLSCNIEPDSLRDSRCGERDFKFISGKAAKRLRLLIDKRLQKQFFSPPSSTDGNPILLHVILSEFASWCLYIMKFDIPKELAEFAKDPDAEIVPKEENKQPSLNSKVSKTKNRKNQKIWDEAKLKVLWNEILQPGVTQEFLGQKYGVSRQRIGSLIKQAKDQLGMKNLWPIQQLTSPSRTVKDKKY